MPGHDTMLTHNRQTRARTNEKSFHKNSHVGIYRNTDNHHTTNKKVFPDKSPRTPVSPLNQ